MGLGWEGEGGGRERVGMGGGAQGGAPSIEGTTLAARQVTGQHSGTPFLGGQGRNGTRHTRRDGVCVCVGGSGGRARTARV